MPDALKSLIATGTKLWLDSIDPELVSENRSRGATGATSNPIIIADLIKTGRFDAQLEQLLDQGLDDSALAWEMTDQLVRRAQLNLPQADRVARYIELGRQWSTGHDNRMIKVPATPAGLAALEELAAAGITLNVTLIFSARQYQAAREAVWRGAQRRRSLDGFKSVYSIFVSRLDVYTEKHAANLSPAAQGQVGIVNAKRLWSDNRDFWTGKGLPLAQEIIFASTGTKKPEDAPWKYVAAFAGGDIQTNPPATNQAVLDSGRAFTSQLATMPPPEVLAEIDAKVDFEHLERTLMDEGIKKFADPQKSLLSLIATKRKSLARV